MIIHLFIIIKEITFTAKISKSESVITVLILNYDNEVQTSIVTNYISSLRMFDKLQNSAFELLMRSLN